MIEYLVLTKNNERTKNYEFKCSEKKIEDFEEEMVIEYFFGEFDFDSIEDLLTDKDYNFSEVDNEIIEMEIISMENAERLHVDILSWENKIKVLIEKSEEEIKKRKDMEKIKELKEKYPEEFK
tara:strand:- start:25963 stop:26331 length:369 start_codon:yes stop_codon:yes gene_type:complete